jgi:hypothetical protein
MTLRRISGYTSLIATPALTIGLALAAVPAGACDGTNCIVVASAKTSNPLNLNQFMRPSPAKKKSGTVATRHGRSRSASRTQRAQPTAVPLPPLPAGAVTSYAAQSNSPVPVVSSGELNALDRAASPVLSETVGAGSGSEPPVRLVAATDFNEIDRMAEASRADSERAGASSNVSWGQWLWSILRGALDTVAEAFRQLIG